MLTDDARYRILKALQAKPDISQRELARELGVSLGKVNYCLQALIEKGMIKAKNFGKSSQKQRYLYVLTPSGMEDKARTTSQFLKRKIAEYDALKLEIEEIQKELESTE
ncbi:MarR family EPS-associated transcriptional regulator [Pseudohongiella acticola]|uniref:MarR family EPS-associated transcriptional regulator n=1 Tax=Pseudohongiella acticola TaxID=1524254 RepID=A0A1E8CH68_9GAMM|nr:MarR family EPS-associated transcriptional regulator [Pseudohongiella acticola]OFE11742.1 MarR family EPS-associated transcriptional regulator [Pseudohongiella acticola]